MLCHSFQSSLENHTPGGRPGHTLTVSNINEKGAVFHGDFSHFLLFSPMPNGRKTKGSAHRSRRNGQG